MSRGRMRRRRCLTDPYEFEHRITGPDGGTRGFRASAASSIPNFRRAPAGDFSQRVLRLGDGQRSPGAFLTRRARIPREHQRAAHRQARTRVITSFCSFRRERRGDSGCVSQPACEVALFVSGGGAADHLPR